MSESDTLACIEDQLKATNMLLLALAAHFQDDEQFATRLYRQAEAKMGLDKT